MDDISGLIEKILRHEVLHLGPVVITSTVINTWIVMAVLLVAVWFATRGGFHLKPRGIQVVLEMLAGFIIGLLEDAMGREGRRYLPIAGTFFVFILVLNLSWFIPNFVPPTTDLMTTAALAVTAILVVQAMGIRKHGFGGYLAHFAQPVAIMLPMNVLEEVIKPFSLAVRLFGNMFGEKTVVTILAILAPLVVPIPVMVLGLLFGAIQAFVFTLLTVTYLATQTHGH